MSPRLGIVYASDEANAHAVAVSARSLVNHWPQASVIVLAHQWQKESKDFLSRSFMVSENVTRIDIQATGLPPGQAHISSATFIRLLIPDLLPDLDLCLYLDADTLVRGSVKELLHSTVFGGRSTAAVRDSEVPNIGSSPGCQWRAEGLDPHADYVNAGVLVMDLERWRDESIGSRALEWIRRNPRAWGDNDAICATLNGDVALLPRRFNATLHMMRQTSPVYGYERADDVDGARLNPTIVHFTGAIKPWHSNAVMPFLDEWRQTAADLGWVNFAHSFTWKRRLERFLIQALDSQA